MKTQNYLIISFILLLSLGHSSSVFAIDIPSESSAGAESSRIEQDLKSKAKKDVFEALPKEKISEEVQPSKQQRGLVFQLKSVEVKGSESISAPELEALASDYVGKEVTFEDLQNITSAMKRYYRERGFVAVYVYLPAQDVSEGNVQIAVVEGELGNVQITGNKWYSDRVIRKKLDFSAGAVIEQAVLREGVARLNRHPDIKASVLLKPGTEYKITDAEIEVEDKFPLHITTEVNNRGTRDTGRARWGIGAVHNNLFGLTDILSSNFQIGSGAVAVGTSYVVPVGPWNTELGFSYSYAHVDVGGDFEAFGVEGDATVFGPSIRQKVFDQDYLEVDLNLGMDFKSIENTVLGAKAGKDELRILNTGFNIVQTDRYGKTYFPTSFHLGLNDFLGGSEITESGATRPGTGGRFFIYRSSLSRFQRLPLGLSLVMRGSVQLATDPLPASEQLRLGGAFSVRGYPEGDYLADYGAFLASEVYIPSFWFPEDWQLPFSEIPLRKQVQVVTFFDFGGGRLREPSGTNLNNKFLAGAGGGLRIYLFDRVFARFQWGHNFGNKAKDSANSAFYYGISAELF